ncbi:MAG: hypothetical protein WAM61_03080 [Desulfobacterales bacterium]
MTDPEETAPALPDSNSQRRGMKEILILLVVIGVWILLQAIILPKMGIST